MTFSWKRAGIALGVVALVAAIVGIGYFWSSDFAAPERRAGNSAATAYASPCSADDVLLPGAPARAPTGADRTTLKIASIAPQNSLYASRLIDAATGIREQTSGRVVLKFDFGGIHGDAERILMKMRTGMLHGATFSAAELAGRYPDIALYGLPFLFRSADEVAHVREKLDAQLHAGLEEAGFVTFCVMSAGFSRLMSTEPIRSRVDLLQREVWVSEDDLPGYAFFRQAGLNPVPLPVGDLMVALQTGLVDVAPVTPVGAVVMQWHTEVDYLTRLPLQYRYGLLAVDREAFSKIAPDDQRVVRHVLNAAFRELDGSAWHGETQALQALADNGITMVDPDAEWAGELRKLGDEVAVQLIQDGEISSELYDRARDLIEEYRESN